MQVNNTNTQQIPQNVGYQTCTPQAPAQQTKTVQQVNIPCTNTQGAVNGLQSFIDQSKQQVQQAQQQAQQACSACYQQTPSYYSLPMQYYGVQPQNNSQASSPAVNIQIINPSVATPGASPTYNVNAPSYPANYYTQDMCKPAGQQYPNNQNGGVNNPGGPNNQNSGAQNGGVNNPANPNNPNSDVNNSQNNPNQNGGVYGQNNPDGTSSQNQQGGNGQNVGSSSTNTTTNNTEINGKKKELRNIVQIDDNYIRTLENYLNSKDKNLRLMGAKRVYDRLEEDDSRHDDKALTALINKMLQDPSQEIRLIAMSAIEGGLVDGDDYTANVLRKMQSSKEVYGQDSIDASNALLKMSEKTVKKEFEVKDDKKKKSTTSSDSTSTTTTTNADTQANEKKE